MIGPHEKFCDATTPEECICRQLAATRADERERILAQGE